MARTLSGGEGLSLPLPARHLPEGTLGSERHEHGAALVCVGVEEEGFREVLAVEVAGKEKGGLRFGASRAHRLLRPFGGASRDLR